MALCSAKRNAILQLCNCISTSAWAIPNIKQLSDGEFFVNTINSAFPEFSKDTDKSESEAVNCDKDVNAIQSTTVTPEAENANSEVVKNIVVASTELSGDKDILWRFTYVQTFIDDHYELKSEEIISYNQCIESNELELAKVAIFVLSEVVKHYVHLKNDHLQTLSHLDIKVQEDLEQCFHFFITERCKISKSETEKLLHYPANYKVPCSPSRSPFVTPQRACSSKYRRSLSTSTPLNEDCFIDSPLKSFFESPIFKKEDIFVKNKELEKYRKALYEEELKCEDLQYELKEVKKAIDQKEQEIKVLKEEVRQLKENIEELLSKEEACKEMFAKEKVQHENRILFLSSELTSLHTVLKEHVGKIKTLEDQLKPKKENELSKDLRRRSLPDKDRMEVMLHKDAEIKALRENECKLKQQLKDTLKDLSAYKSMMREKNSSWKEEPGTPIVNENIGDIIDEDNRNLQAELKDARLQINKLIEENMRLKKGVQNEKKELSFRNSSDHLSMPKLIDPDYLTEKEKLRSVKRSNSVKDFTSLSIEHSPLNSSVPKQPSTSTMWEGNLPTENISEAVLWRRYNSESELENNLSTDCMDIENDLSMGRDASVVKCEDVVSYSNSQENTEENCIQGVPENNTKTDGASVKDNSVLEQATHIFLNFFKGLSTNGSYKCEIKDLKNLKTLLRTSPNGSNGHDPQVLLIKILDSLISAVPQEEGTRHVSGTSHSANRTETKEINELKCRLTEKSSLLKEKEDEFNKLKSEYDSLEMKYQALVQEKDEIIKNKEDYHERLQQSNKRLENMTSKNSEIAEKVAQYTFKYSRLKDAFRKLKEDHESLQAKLACKIRELEQYAGKDAYLVSLSTRLAQKENDIKEFREKLAIYKSKNVELKRRIKDFQLAESDLKTMLKNLKLRLLKNEKSSKGVLHSLNNVTKKRGSSVLETDEEIDDPSCSHNSLNVLPQYSATSHDRSNGSVLSGALYWKSKTPFVLENQDEEDFLNHSSISTTMEKCREDRIEELKRRNSILPIHLQSVYPTEANLPLPCDDLYVRNTQREKYHNHQEDARESNSKKRKLDNQRENSFKTPIRIQKYSMRTPASVKKLLQRKRITCPGFLKPKP